MFDKPFAYDRASGHLLLQYGMDGMSGAYPDWDVYTSDSSKYTLGGPRVFPGAIVTEFTYEVVPEPRSFSIFLAAVFILGLARRASFQP